MGAKWLLIGGQILYFNSVYIVSCEKITERLNVLLIMVKY